MLAYPMSQNATVKVMGKKIKKDDKNTLFLRFSGEAMALSEWIEKQQKALGFKNRQEFVLNVIRKQKAQQEQQAA